MVDISEPQVLQHLFDIDTYIDSYDWKPFKKGVEIYRIYGDDSTGPAAALLRYEAGADVPIHEHKGYEHILILSGSQTDGKDVYQRGTLMISSPGSQHKIASETGCVVLAIWQAPVDFSIGKYGDHGKNEKQGSL